MSRKGLELAARCTVVYEMEGEETHEILLGFIKKRKGIGIKEVTAVLEKSNSFHWYQFIAWLKKINDVFDKEVVELFWKPTLESLDQVKREQFKQFLSEGEIPEPKQEFLLSFVPGDSFYPCHNFLILSNFNGENLSFVDNCELSIGRITGIEKAGYKIIYLGLAYDKETKELSLMREEKWIQKELVKNAHNQEVVIFHRNFAVARASDQEMTSIPKATQRMIELFNQSSKK